MVKTFILHNPTKANIPKLTTKEYEKLVFDLKCFSPKIRDVFRYQVLLAGSHPGPGGQHPMVLVGRHPDDCRDRVGVLGSGRPVPKPCVRVSAH